MKVPVVVNRHRVKAGKRVTLNVQFHLRTGRKLAPLLRNGMQEFVCCNAVPIPLSMRQIRVRQAFVNVEQKLLTERQPLPLLGITEALVLVTLDLFRTTDGIGIPVREVCD